MLRWPSLARRPDSTCSSPSRLAASVRSTCKLLLKLRRQLGLHGCNCRLSLLDLLLQLIGTIAQLLQLSVQPSKARVHGIACYTTALEFDIDPRHGSPLPLGCITCLVVGRQQVFLLALQVGPLRGKCLNIRLLPHPRDYGHRRAQTESVQSRQRPAQCPDRARSLRSRALRDLLAQVVEDSQCFGVITISGIELLRDLAAHLYDFRKPGAGRLPAALDFADAWLVLRYGILQDRESGALASTDPPRSADRG